MAHENPHSDQGNGVLMGGGLAMFLSGVAELIASQKLSKRAASLTVGGACLAGLGGFLEMSRVGTL